MPNWCETVIAFYGDKDTVQDFKDKIIAWTKPENDICNHEFGSNYLGNIFAHVFGKECMKDNKNSFNFNGTIENYFYDNVTGCFTVMTTSAWTPPINMWYKILDKLCPNKDIKMAYEACEPMEEKFLIHDPDYQIHSTNDLWYIYGEGGPEDILGLDNLNGNYCQEELLKAFESTFPECDIDFTGFDKNYLKIEKKLQEYIKSKNKDNILYMYKYDKV